MLNKALFGLALILSAFPLMGAEIHCRVINGTTMHPCSPESAVVLKLVEGMQEIQALRNPGPTFSFKNLPADQQYLLQITYQSVRYNFAIAFGQSESIDKEITVYNVADDDSHIMITIPSLLVSLEYGRMKIHLMCDVRNDGTTVYSGGAAGTFKFSLPDGFSVVESATATSAGMPTHQRIVKLPGDPSYAMDYPIRPGNTQIELEYSASFSGGFDYHQKFYYPVVQTNVFMKPSSVSVRSIMMHKVGEKEEGSAAYVSGPIAKGASLDFSLNGTAAVAGASQEADKTAAESGPRVEEQPPSLYRYRIQIILLLVFITSFSFWHGLREPKGELRSPKKKARR